MIKIKINYTAYCVDDWELIFEKHVFHLSRSGLYDACDQFNVFQFPKNERLGEIVRKYGISDKTSIVQCDSNQYEFPAVKDLIFNPSDLNLYFHTKGVTYKNRPRNYIPSIAWNEYMTYFNVRNWRICTGLLKGNASVGVEFGSSLSEPNKFHYSGNFWWTTGEHL